jgi:hypothetical protein
MLLIWEFEKDGEYLPAFAGCFCVLIKSLAVIQKNDFVRSQFV